MILPSSGLILVQSQTRHPWQKIPMGFPSALLFMKDMALPQKHVGVIDSGNDISSTSIKHQTEQIEISKICQFWKNKWKKVLGLRGFSALSK